MYLDSVPTHYRIHQFSGYSRYPRFGKTNGHSIQFVLRYELSDNTRNRQVIQVCSSLVQSSDLKTANQNNNLLTTMIADDPTNNYRRSIDGGHLHPNDDPIRMNDVCVQGFEWFEHRIFRQINANNNDLARSAKCRFCDFFGSQRVFQNHKV